MLLELVEELERLSLQGGVPKQDVHSWYPSANWSPSQEQTRIAASGFICQPHSVEPPTCKNNRPSTASFVSVTAELASGRMECHRVFRLFRYHFLEASKISSGFGARNLVLERRSRTCAISGLPRTS